MRAQPAQRALRTPSGSEVGCRIINSPDWPHCSDYTKKTATGCFVVGHKVNVNAVVLEDVTSCNTVSYYVSGANIASVIKVVKLSHAGGNLHKIEQRGLGCCSIHERANGNQRS